MATWFDLRHLFGLAALGLLAWSGCATTGLAPVEDSTLVVEVEGPADSRDDAAKFREMVLTHVSSRRPSVDECYLSEVLSGSSTSPAQFEFSIQARPGTRVPVVVTKTTSDPDQRLLENCVREAISARPFPRREIRRHTVDVTITAPEWITASS